MRATAPSLKPNKLGYYEVRWSEKVAGKWKSCRVSAKTKDVEQANEFLAGWLQIRNSPNLRTHLPTINTLLKEYLDSATKRDVGPTQNYGVKQLSKILGTKTPVEITPQVIFEYTQDRLNAGRQGSTVRRELNVLVAALNYAKRQKRIARADVPYIDLPPNNPPRDLWLNEAQEAEFLKLAANTSFNEPRPSRVHRFVWIALSTGARKQAIEELTWDRVDFAADKIDFEVPGRRRTKKRRSAMAIPSRLRPLLEEARDCAIDEYVIDRGNIRGPYDRFRVTTPYPWATIHILRHTCGTLMARAGVDLWQISGVLGDTIKTVTENYLKHTPGHLKSAVDRRRSS